ncbi:MAG: hypothetical protein QF473_10715, partial [Planctomycetota bacterium]|nr:hypothetical protein [Planctomycetota bacterium]
MSRLSDAGADNGQPEAFLLQDRDRRSVSLSSVIPTYVDANVEGRANRRCPPGEQAAFADQARRRGLKQAVEGNVIYWLSAEET